MAAWALLTALGPAGITSAGEGNVATLFGDTTAVLMGAVFPDLVNVLVVTSTFACLLAAHNTVARYGYSLGRDGVFPQRMGEAHRRYHSPFLASLLLTVLEIGSVTVIALASKFEPSGEEAFTVYIRMNGLGALSIVFLMCLVSVAILGYFARNAAHKMESGIWRSLIAPGIGLIGLLVILALGIFNVDALIDAGTLVSGLLALLAPLVFLIGYFYASSLQKKKPEVFAKIGRQ